MDKDELVAFTERYHNGNITVEEALKLIFQYCIDAGIEEDRCRQFIEILPSTGCLPYCLNHALNWYKAKFNVTELIKPKSTGQVVIKVF